MAHSALTSVIKVAGGASVVVGGSRVNALLIRDERGLDPILGGMVSQASQNIMVSKRDLPERPAENADILFDDGELSSFELVAGSVTDRGGYWLINCQEAVG